MELLRDARYTIRWLAKSPGFTVAALITLSLAIGANSAIFSVVHAVLLKPLPIQQPQDLVMVWETAPSRNQTVAEVSYLNFEQWAAHATSFTQAAAVGSSTWPEILDRNGERSRVATAGVTASFFDTLGAPPILGRAFRRDDDLPHAPLIAILSYDMWHNRFGANPAVVGTIVHLDHPRTIVGVMPQGFEFPRGTDFWIPVGPVLASSAQPGSGVDPFKDVGVLFVIGRLRAGVSGSTAAAELDALAKASSGANAAPRFGEAVIVTPFLDYLFGPVRRALWALWAAVSVLLLIACGNVSGLMLTRAAGRRHDHAIRLALGATRARLGRMWALESLALATAGGLLAWLLSGWLLKAIIALAPSDVAQLADVSMNPTVAAFTFAAVLATALLCAAAPARQAGTTNLLDALSDASRATTVPRTQRLRHTLVVIQISLAVVLLVSTGLIVRSFIALRQLDVGFVSSDVVTMFVGGKSNAWMDELLQQIRALPQVSSAGAVYLRPLELGPIGQDAPALLDGQTNTAGTAKHNPLLNYQVATTGYFETMRVKLLRGRLFSREDVAGQPRVAIVGESTARRLFPGQNPVGKRVWLPLPNPAPASPATQLDPTQWRTIIGVVADVHYRGLGDVRYDIYDAAPQTQWDTHYLVIRTTANPAAIAASVRAVARRLDPAVVVDNITTLDAIVSRAVAPWRFSTWMLTLFAMLGFVLATVGLFSVVSLDVANRRHELAVRLALGAQRVDVLRALLLPAAARILAGIVAGTIAAALGTRAIRSLLFGVTPIDTTTWSVVLLLVTIVVSIASYLPARRAARIDPVAALRNE